MKKIRLSFSADETVAIFTSEKERCSLNSSTCVGVTQTPPGGNYRLLSVRFSHQLWTAAGAETETAQGVSSVCASDLFGLLSVCWLLLLLQKLSALRSVLICLLPLRFNTFTTTHWCTSPTFSELAILWTLNIYVESYFLFDHVV